MIRETWKWIKVRTIGGRKKLIPYEDFWKAKGDYGEIRVNRMLKRKHNRHQKRLENKEKERQIRRDLDELDY